MSRRLRFRTVGRFCRSVIAVAVAALGAALLCVPARALDYPTRTVRIILPFTAGGAPDVVLRIVAQALRERWGQPVVVENRAGGNTMVGTAAAAKSLPDGYTLLFASDQATILNPLLYASLPYDENDLEPIILVATTPHMMGVKKNLPVKSVTEFVALAKAKPATLLYGSSGPGSVQRLATEYFSSATGIKLVHVPYRGAPEATTALLAGEIDMTITGMSNLLPHISSGAIRALAITTAQRSPLAPQIPTMQEAGVPGYVSQGAFGLMAPNGVPQEIRDKIRKDVAAILQQASIKQMFEQRSFEVGGGGPDEFKRFVEEERNKWRRVITQANIKGD